VAETDPDERFVIEGDPENALRGLLGNAPGRYACPCCGYLTLANEPPGTYAICEVCFWEDDGVQFRDPDYTGGANRVSLSEARDSFVRHGVADERFASNVRPPTADERP
jgi:hypothetical protein